MNVTTILPPTTNTLDARQRGRLIRSARKLGAVLGSTPQLLEPSSPARLPIGPSRPSTPRRRSPPSTPPLYASSTNSSVASLALPTPRTSSESLPEPRAFASKPRRSKELPPALVLRLHAVPLSHADPRVRVDPPTPSPTTPTTPVPPSCAEARRRRMAKLQRTLGDGVPRELVFAPPAPAAPQALLAVPAHAPHARRLSTSGGLPRARSSRVWVTGSAAWTGEWNRRDIRDVQQQLRALRA